MPASSETTAVLAGLSPVADKPIIAVFDADGFSASGGLLTLREIEQRLSLAPHLAAHILDPREVTQVVHPIADIVRFRMLMIAAGYEDGNDADVLRHDPMFKLAMGRLPTSEPLCSQSTISRLENLPDKRTLLRMGYGMIDFYCDSFRQVPRRIVLDIDDHFDAAHGEQELRVFNAHYDEHGFSPIVVFDGDGRLVGAVLRPARRPSGREIVMLLRRLIGRLRANWPRIEILLRGDSHYCAPEVLRFCRNPGGLGAGRGDDIDLAPPYHRPGAEHGETLRCRRRCREVPSLQGILRWCRELGPRRADHRPRRGRVRRGGYTLHHHQSRWRLRACRL